MVTIRFVTTITIKPAVRRYKDTNLRVAVGTGNVQLVDSEDRRVITETKQPYLKASVND